jgi:peptidoglycan hydrolase-like protein with peptidoglycan-binding domain
MKRKRILVAVAAMAAATAAMVSWQLVSDPGETEETASTDPTAEPAVETAEVIRGDLTNDYDFTGQVSFGESWVLPLQLQGVVTAGHAPGTVVDPGEMLIEVGGGPVFLADGEVPMYRELALASTHTTGDDVAQLQRFLLAAGFDDDGRLVVDGDFGPSTRSALKDWQESLGLEETGRVDASLMVFSPTPLRVESAPRVGTAFDSLEVTEAAPTVTVDISSSERTQLPVDGSVTMELADGTTLNGTVVDQERVVGEDGSTFWRAVIEVDGNIDGDEASALVYSTVVDASDVLLVPTSALLAVAEGGFALEVVDGDTTRLVPVQVGKVVDARAEITGDLQPGDPVVVPS